jgi:subtilisin
MPSITTVNTMYDPIVTLPPDLKIEDDISLFSDETWHLPRELFRKIRKISSGRGVKVAVLDTGCFPHPTLPEPVFRKSYVGQSAMDPRSGHGTHCAGTILSRDEDIGIAPEADLEVHQVLSDSGSGGSQGITDAINQAIDNGVDIVSMSLGGGGSYNPTNVAIKRAMDSGIITCIAAGNSGFNGTNNTIGWPAKSKQGVVVAALKQDFTPANFSSGGIEMTIAAPGQQILSCDNRGPGFRFMSGTSMATPFVAGCFALILSYMRSQGRPSMTGVEAVNKFISTNATDLLKPGHDPSTGHGMFSMLEVMERLSQDTLLYV